MHRRVRRADECPFPCCPVHSWQTATPGATWGHQRSQQMTSPWARSYRITGHSNLHAFGCHVTNGWHTLFQRKETALLDCKGPATCLDSRASATNARQVSSFNDLLMTTKRYYYGLSDDAAMLALSKWCNFPCIDQGWFNRKQKSWLDKDTTD